MMAPGFKPVGWVAAVAGAALGCYMLSLNVASERAELAKLERRIIAAKQDIRSLQTELGTRGRMQQLEHWNADVLALSAPTSAQFLDNEVRLARFDVRQRTLDNPAPVRMASAEAPKAPAKPQVQFAAAASAAPIVAQPLVRKAALMIGEDKPLPVKKAAEVLLAPVKSVPANAAPSAKPKMIDDDLVAAVREAAKSETAGGRAGR